MPLNIAIDGPAGAGKSTIAAGIAAALNILHLDTGAMYRAMALAALRRGISLSEEDKVCALCGQVKINVAHGLNGQITLLDGEDVSEAIRLPEVSMGASAVSRYAQVRAYMVARQQAYARSADLVMDGRDIGTHVLPHTKHKFYLDAAQEERARRRHEELHAKGMPDTYEEVLAALIERDQKDMGRTHSPLRCAEDALRIDTTRMTIAQAIDAILIRIKEDGV